MDVKDLLKRFSNTNYTSNLNVNEKKHILHIPINSVFANYYLHFKDIKEVENLIQKNVCFRVVVHETSNYYKTAILVGIFILYLKKNG